MKPSATARTCNSCAQSLRHRLAGKIEVIELAPPAVQTDLTPGQATRDGFMPLHPFIDEEMDLFARSPTPPEFLVERVKCLRDAEVDGRFGAAFAMLKPPA